jgi:hypothetical protein
MAFDSSMFSSGIGSLFGGLFGHPGRAYDKEAEQYQKYANMGARQQQPYANAGNGALGNLQTWLEDQKDPMAFINQLMGGYSESPYAQYLQQQAQSAGENYGSANGLMGSTPLMQQMQQNAANISSQDQNKWLQNVLGINSQYGQGQQGLVNTGQTSANNLTNLYNNLGQNMGQVAYNKESSKQNNLWNTLGGIGSILGSFL